MILHAQTTLGIMFCSDVRDVNVYCTREGYGESDVSNVADGADAGGCLHPFISSCHVLQLLSMQ